MKIYNTLEEVSQLKQNQVSVFLAGPSSRDSDTTSYRQEFLQYLEGVEADKNIEFVVFNPEGTEWNQGKGKDYAHWELARLEGSHVVVIGLNNDNDKLPGLTTRTEVGLLVGENRRNLVVWCKPNSYRTGYMKTRCEEAGHPVTSDMNDAAKLVYEVYKRNIAFIDVREGKYGATEIRPNGCDAFYLKRAILTAQEENKKGAIYVYLPLFDTYNYGKVVLDIGGYEPFTQTPKYSIVCKWNGEEESMIPEAATSIEGAFAMIVDETGDAVCLGKPKGKKWWGFFGGSVNSGETKVEACERELFEETGVNVLIDLSKTHIVGSYNQANARTYGVWDEGDPKVTRNDNFTVFKVTIPRNTEFKREEREIEEIRWFSVVDILYDKVEGINSHNLKVIKGYFTFPHKPLHLQCSVRDDKPNKITF